MNLYKSILFLAAVGLIAGTAHAQSTFTQPRNGETVHNRLNFKAAVDIEDFSSAGKHWVAIASVTGHARSWERVLKLREKVMNEDDSAARSEMLKLIGNWPLDEFWPKFYVPRSPYGAQVFDGGTNQLSGIEPQPMVLLLRKVDDALHDQILGWFKGKEKPGMPASKLRSGMILARSEIFFP